MTEVKALANPESAYRHRGWLWRDRGTYELFKPYMKLPLWIDRILTGNGGRNLYVVGATDGYDNTTLVGSMTRGPLQIPDTFMAHKARFNCNTNAGNGFVVLAERIRAKKPDADKPARPLHRQPMSKPWEPGLLGNNWVVDGSLVAAVQLDTKAPDRADRLWVSTSGGKSTFVWVDTKQELGAHREYWATDAKGITGRLLPDPFTLDGVRWSQGSHWQLAGVRKKTVWVPEPEVVKPESSTTLTDAIFDPSAQQAPVTGRVAARSPYFTAPYFRAIGRDPYKELAESLGTSRGADAIQAQLQPFVLTQPKSFISDLAAMERLMLAYCTQDVLGTPPLGVKPRNLHDEERANALDEAMSRYLDADLPFPNEWAVEWNELRARLNKEQK